MEYITAGICVAIIAAVCLMVFVKKKAQASKLTMNYEGAAGPGTLTVTKRESQELVIQMEMLPADYIADESKLLEITDSKMLAHVDNLIPGLAQAGNAANNAIQAVRANGEALYRAVIPTGAQLTNSADISGAVRGFFRGADGIRGHANLMAIEAQKGAAIANTTAAAMGVAAMVVGQYYMTQINAELDTISDSISHISDFMDNEYRSRVFALITNVQAIASFQTEILENSELRASKLHYLDSLNTECTQLLGQANYTLDGYAEEKSLDYRSYEGKLKEVQKWYTYQNMLLNVLNKISDLRYALHFGEISRAQCTAQLPTYSTLVVQTQTRLSNWHQDTMERLNIDLSETRRRRDGFDGVIHFIPGLINNKFKFKTIDKNTISIIEEQTGENVNDQQQEDCDLYRADVQLIVKEGKVYYLPESREI